MWAAIGTAPALLVTDVTPEQRRAFTSGDPEEAEFAETHGAASVIIVPLRSGTRDLGIMTCAYTDASGRRYRPDDIELATALGQPVRRADRARVPRTRGGAGAVAPRPARGRERAADRRSRHAGAARRDRARGAPELRRRLRGVPAVRRAAGSGSPRTRRPTPRCGIGSTTLDVVGMHDLDGDAPPAVVMRTGEPMLIGAVTPDVVARLGDAEYADAPRRRGRGPVAR